MSCLFNKPRIMIAGTGSGCGKTTVTCAILKALLNKGLNAASFKSGPDYIDPMFHSEIIGAKSRNLDSFLCGDETVKYLLAKNSKDVDISVIEGVMGYYDGIGMKSSEYSSCNLSLLTKTPAVLVINCAGMSLSSAAVINGYMNFAKNNIKGVVLNNVSAAIYPEYKEFIETHTRAKVYGFLPKMPEASLESRHLGLITAAEIDNLSKKIDLLAQNAEKYIEIDSLIELASKAEPYEYSEIETVPVGNVKIAVAQDKAFCFYYKDSLELLERLGAEIIPFSPLNDDALPSGIDGLIFGGGYPELYAKQLSDSPILKSVAKAIQNGLPTIAECGGFMYLHDSINDQNGCSYPMCGVIKGDVRLTKKLGPFGYITMTSQKDGLLCNRGQTINAHEFHYSESENVGSDFEAKKPVSGAIRDTIHMTDTLYAGYPHLNFWGNIEFAKNFINKCLQYKNNGGKA